MYIQPIKSSLNLEKQQENVSDSLCIRICQLSKTIFQKLTFVLSFPNRYIGAKTWSIPGLIIRASRIAYQKLFSANKCSSEKELFSSGYHFHPEKMKTPEELKGYLGYFCNTAFVHKGDPNWATPFGYKVISPNKLNLVNGITSKGYGYFDKETGLKITVVEKNDQIVITFGSLGSMNSELNIKTDPGKALRSKMIFTAVKNLIGQRPSIYQKANQFLKEIRKHPNFQGKNFIVVGSCFGGAIASYVALKQRITGICTNSLPMGVGLQQNIDPETLLNAEKYVTHFTTEGDWMTGPAIKGVVDRIFNLIGLKTPGNFGKKFVIPCPYKKRKDKHNLFIGSAMHYLGYDKRTKPKDLRKKHENMGDFCNALNNVIK